ncbi:MAG: cation transporter [Pelomonas sp.]|nr:cation transporter [Roseateles sp.]
MQAGSYLKLSVGVAVVTIALKGAAWWWTGSVALAADALESLVNLAGALFALAMLTLAAQPPDAEHPYGHHKAEYFSGGFEGVLIFAAGLGIAVGAAARLLEPQPLEQFGVGVALTVVSTAMNGGLALAMLRKARALRSIALEADARHLITDVWTSAGVLVGLAGVHLTGWQWLDPLAALVVAANVLREGVHLLGRAGSGLMDEALDPASLARIEAALAGFAAHNVRFDHLSTRTAGQRCFVELHMHAPADWTLGRAAAMRGEVERALVAALPGLRASIQLLPTDIEPLDDEAPRPVSPR